MGYVSDSISDRNGIFANPPALIFTFGQNYSSVGITLAFNDYSGDYCSKVNIRWYRDDTLLADRIYHPDAGSYFCYGIVDYYNKVVITFQETSKPYRNVFLTGITWGLIRVFKDNEIDDISCLMELNPISEEVSINTMDYTIRSKSEYAFEFQKRQKQTLYFDEAIMGIFYLKDGKQLGAKRYSVETQDAVGILDNNQFMGWLVANEGRLTVALDINITKELREEGIARELINRIQNLRKESDFNVTDKINLYIGKHKEINEAVENFKAYIASQVLAENVTLIDKAEDGAQPIEIDDIQTFIKIQKM